MTPTPEYINICIRTLAAWLQTQGYGCAIIAPTGGASFHQRSVFEERAELFAKVTALEDEKWELREALDNIDRIASRGDVNIQPLLAPIMDVARAALAARTQGDTK